MLLIAMIAIAVCVSVFLIVWTRRRKAKRELEENCIDPEALHALIEANRKVLVFDIRQPLDLLAYSEVIPGAVRIPPKNLLENPLLIPKDEDAVVYCTCEGEKTSREVVRRAKTLNFRRLKLLKGGLAGWKAKGFPVERYTEAFRLDTAV